MEPYSEDEDTQSPSQSGLMETMYTIPVTDLFAGLVAVSPPKRMRGSLKKQISKSPDASAQSCSFRLPGAVDTEDEVIIAGARSSFKSTKCHYCSTQEGSDEAGLESPQEEEEEQTGIRFETKHEVNVSILVLHHDDNIDGTNSDSKPQQDTESGCDETAPSRVSNEDIIDRSPRDIVPEDVPSTPPQDDISPADDDDVLTRPDAPVPYIQEDNLEEELECFDETINEGDEYLNHLDDLLERCPQTSIIRSLHSATELSRRYTHQIEEAINRWNEITNGPFPAQLGTSLTRAQVINAESSKSERKALNV